MTDQITSGKAFMARYSETFKELAMTEENELIYAIAKEAHRRHNLPGIWPDVAIIAARLASEGWTPPKPVDPDLAEAEALWLEGMTTIDLALAGIKRGRELERAEAKPKTVWVKHDGSFKCPIDPNLTVWAKNDVGRMLSRAENFNWAYVTEYFVLTN